MLTDGVFWRLGLLLFAVETLIMFATALSPIRADLFWLATGLNVAATTGVAVPTIRLWLRHNPDITQNALKGLTFQVCCVLIIAEGSIMAMLHVLPFDLTVWQESLLDGVCLSMISTPIIYPWIRLPVDHVQNKPALALPPQTAIALLALTCFSIFMFDLALPLGVASGSAYILVVLGGLWLQQKNAALCLALAGTILTVLGYFLSPELGLPWMAISNRVLAIVMLWITAMLIVNRKSVTNALELSSAVFNAAPGAITITDSQNRIIAVNPAFTAITGYTAAEVIGKNPNILQSGRQSKEFYQDLWQSLLNHGTWQGEIWNRNKAGFEYPERLSLGVLKNSQGEIINHIALFQDISDQKRAERDLGKRAKEFRLLHVMAESANTASDFNEALQTGLSYVCAYMDWPVGHAFLRDADNQGHIIASDIWHLEHNETYRQFVDATENTVFGVGEGLPGQVVESGRSIRFENMAAHPDLMRTRPAMDAGLQSGFAIPVLSGTDVVAVMEFYTRDILLPDDDLLLVLENVGRQLGRVFERSQSEAELKKMAYYDSLTKLPGVRLAMDRISHALASARRHKSNSAILFLDLDGFKAVNDTFGHTEGDQLLIKVAERLTSCVREVDTVARIGGDEFVIVLTDVEGVDGAGKVAQTIVDAFEDPFTLGDHVAHVGASIGIALYPDHGETPEHLLKRADQAMYTVKEHGKHNFAFAGTPGPRQVA